MEMKKLKLKKEIISKISNYDMSQVKGGIDVDQTEAYGSMILCFSIGDWGCNVSKSCDSIICVPGH